jgi:hypothetical protein
LHSILPFCGVNIIVNLDMDRISGQICDGPDTDFGARILIQQHASELIAPAKKILLIGTPHRL